MTYQTSLSPSRVIAPSVNVLAPNEPSATTLRVDGVPRQTKVTSIRCGSFSAGSTIGVPAAARAFQNASVLVSPRASCCRNASIVGLTYFSCRATGFRRSSNDSFSANRSVYFPLVAAGVLLCDSSAAVGPRSSSR